MNGNGTDNGIQLDETIDALRTQLLRAVDRSRDAEIHFPVTGIQIQFHVGVTRVAEGRAGLRFWIVELGASGTYSEESIQTVTISLGAPVDNDGVPVKVSGVTRHKP